MESHIDDAPSILQSMMHGHSSGQHLIQGHSKGTCNIEEPTLLECSLKPLLLLLLLVLLLVLVLLLLLLLLLRGGAGGHASPSFFPNFCCYYCFIENGS